MNLNLSNEPPIDRTGQFSKPWTSLFTLMARWITANSQSGSTANRPTDNLDIGTDYFDTTLGYGIKVKQVKPTVVWVRWDGTPV